MSEHTATVQWELGAGSFGLDYDRSHVWRFDSGVEVPASSAPQLSGDPTRVDPEEAFVASVSSCHMLWFLHLSAEGGWTVTEYSDDAVGTMARDESGAVSITDVALHPRIEWAGLAPTPAEIESLHHQSHEKCFIANSIRSMVRVLEPGA